VGQNENGEAIKAVRSEEMCLNKKKTSNVFEVSRSTLKYKLNSKERDIEKLSNIRLGWKPVMSYNLAEELVTYCLMMERKFLGVTTRRNVKIMAFELAVKNGLARSLSVQGRAG